MTLFLQNDAGGSGTGGVFPDRGFGHLVEIANMDTGIGQNAAVGDLIQITYTETLTGIPPDRLDDLVNTDFSGVSGTTDIIVIPVDETFVRPNGHHVTENAVRIDDADEVAVEVGWSDTPFYRDPRTAAARGAHPAAQLRSWERGLATGRAALAKGPSAG